MKQTFKKCLSVALLVSATALTAGTSPVASVIKIRPQSLDNARKVAGEVGLTHLYDVNEWYANFDTTFEYQRSFRSGDIAHCLFGDDLIKTSTIVNSCDDSCDSGKTLLIQGSAVTNRNANALLADYFYLPAAFDGALTFKPVISSFVMNFNFYMGMDEWVRGMFFRIYAPFVHTKWDLNMSESPASGATGTVPALRFSPAAIPNANLLTSASAYFAGNTPTSLTQTTGGDNPSDVTIVRNPLAFHKMLGSRATSTANGCCDNDCDDSCNSRTKNGFGEIRAELGWNFWQNEDYHLGLYLAAAAPTAGRAHAEFLFDPYIGNNKHWELGGGIAGHYVFWRSEDEAKHFGIYMDTTVTHLFKSKEQRVFDLQGKPLSRYALAAKVNTAATGSLTGTLAGTPTLASFQFSNEFTPVANLTAQDVNVSVGAQVDLALWLNFTSGGFSWDLGYDLWLQTCEKLSCSDCGPVLRREPNTWVLAGDALVYGVGATTSTAYPLSVSESGATINAGTNGTSAINGGVDNPQLASNTDGAAQNLNNAAAAQLNLSLPIMYLSEANISNEQQNKPLSNKIWTHFNYTWDREGVVPYFGIGGAAEFGSNDSKDDCDTTPAPTTSCKSDECIRCTVSQWQIWAKIGVSFD